MKNRVDILLENLGFSLLNPIQEAMVKSNSNDKVLLSATGSGKTWAFLLPAVLFCDENPNKKVLILVPSRELALQIERVLKDAKSGISASCCYGGHSIHIEKRSLLYSPQVIIGTPGRLLDHITHGNIDPLSVGMVIFDEFDKLLELGFTEEMSSICVTLTNISKRVLTSATKSVSIPDFVSLANNYETIDFLPQGASGDITLKRIDAKGGDKLEILLSLVCMLGNDPMIIFCNFRERAEEVSDFLYDHYIENEFFHGGMEQFDREKALAKFRNGSCSVLVSTDLASRGLDIPEVKHIIHFHLPQSQEAFTHRNGRTARMSRSGTAFVLVDSMAKEAPDYVKAISEEFYVDLTKKTPPAPKYSTIYIGLGKKDKVNKVDVLGFLCQKGAIEKSDVGVIEIKDFHSFAAVKFEKISDVMKLIRNEKIKGKSTKIELSK